MLLLLLLLLLLRTLLVLAVRVCDAERDPARECGRDESGEAEPGEEPRDAERGTRERPRLSAVPLDSAHAPNKRTGQSLH
jgi:hypothetical protein